MTNAQTTEDAPRDAQLASVFDQLGGDDAPMALLLADVEQRMSLRRQRRRRVVIASSAAAVAGVVAVAAVAVGRDGTDRPSVASQGGASTLTITRNDGSTYTFGQVSVDCRNDPDEGGRVVWVMSDPPPTLVGDSLSAPLLTLDVNPAMLDGADETFDLPIGGQNSGRPFTLFAAFEASGGQDGNEVSSAEPGASGTVEISNVSCGPNPTIDIVVDAVLGSEVSQPALKMSGELHWP